MSGLNLKKINRPPAGRQRCSVMRMGIQAAERLWAHGGRNGHSNVHGVFRACKVTQTDRSIGSLCGSLEGGGNRR